MPISFPMGLDDFLGALLIKSLKFELPEAVQSSRTRGGQVLIEEIGEQLWEGEVILDNRTADEAQDAQALIDLMRRGNASFLAWHTRFPNPRRDRSGAGLVGAAPRILGLDPGDARLMSLKGLPAGYVLSRGDYLSFRYGTPERYGLHRVIEASVVADGSGETALFEVQPPVEPGAALDTDVVLSRAHCKAIIVPDSVQTGRQGKFIREDMSFRFMQTLR